MKGSFKIKVILVCLLLYSFESIAQHQNLDSLFHALELHKQEDTNRVNLLLVLGSTIWKLDHEQGLLLVQEGIDLSVKLKWKKGEAMGLLNRSSIKSWDNLFHEALQDALSALKITEKINDQQLVGSIYHRLAWINVGIKDLNTAEAYALKFLEIGKERKDEKTILDAVVTLGSIYGDMENWKSAEKHQKEGLDRAKALNDKYMIGRSLMAIAEKEELLKNYKEAENYHLQNLSLQREIQSPGGEAYIDTRLSLISAHLNNKDSAFYYAHAALEVVRQYHLKKELLDAYFALYFAASRFHDYQNALRYYLVYDSLMAVNHNMETGRNLESTKAQFEKEKNDAIALKELQKQKLIRNGFVAGFIVVLIFAEVFFSQRNKIKKGKKRSDELLLNILPPEVAEELKAKGTADAKQFDEVTVLFTDFKDFTQISEKLTPAELVEEINICFKAFDLIIDQCNIEKIKTIGDSYMCAGGLPVINTTHAIDVVHAAIEIQKFMQQHKQHQKNEGKEPFETRIGIHTGPVVAGIVGVKKFAYDIWGDTVNIASRMESSGETGKVNISGSTYKLVKDKYKCTYRGKIQAKHKGEIDMYFVERLL